MNDDFLTERREEPRPEFAQALRRKLRAQEEAEEASPARESRWSRWRPAFVSLASAAGLTALLMVPSVRVAAQGFLELFRVKKVAAVPADFQRLDELADNIDMKALLGDHVQVLVDPGPLRRLDGVEEAADLTGMPIKLPAELPRGVTGPTVRYRPEGLFKVTADMGRVEAILEALKIDDVEIPWEAHGAVFTVKAPPLVEMRYQRGESEIVFLQSRSPEAELPPGVDLARLGEVALRMQGLSAAEARSFAKTIDWSSTLVVPVPTLGSEYREVELHGTKGLLVTMSRHAGRGRSAKRLVAGPPGARRSALVWTADDRLFSLNAPGSGTDLLRMAHSIR